MYSRRQKLARRGLRANAVFQPKPWHADSKIAQCRYHTLQRRPKNVNSKLGVGKFRNCTEFFFFEFLAPWTLDLDWMNVVIMALVVTCCMYQKHAQRTKSTIKLVTTKSTFNDAAHVTLSERTVFLSTLFRHKNFFFTTITSSSVEFRFLWSGIFQWRLMA